MESDKKYLQVCFNLAKNSGHDPDSIKLGMKIVAEAFGIYKNGVQVIGCLETPVKEIIEEINSL